MIGLAEDLAARAATGEPVRFGLIGAGQMGIDIVSQVRQMQGIEVSIVVDIDLRRAADAYAIAGVAPEQVVRATTAAAAMDAIGRGCFVIAEEAHIAAELDAIESIVDATGQPEAGALIAVDCFTHGKNLVMMNVEADITIGPILRRKAEQAGVVYSLAAGDEPTAIMGLYDFARALGLQVVAAGKGKNNPLDIDATPRQCEAEARRRGLSPAMLVEFIDGSKTMIEMASVANATGLIPDVPNMHGPKTSVPELRNVFRLQREGGILSREGVVDYAIGDVAPGVFVNVRTDHPRLRQCLVLRDMGNGPVYTLFRPFHLCSMEVPLTVAAVSLYGRSHMQPLACPSAEVTTVAKRDLRPGDVLDGIGGSTHRAGCMIYAEARAIDALPVGLAKGAEVTALIARGSAIRLDQVRPRSDSLLYRLRMEQNQYVEALQTCHAPHSEC